MPETNRKQMPHRLTCQRRLTYSVDTVYSVNLSSRGILWRKASLWLLAQHAASKHSEFSMQKLARRPRALNKVWGTATLRRFACFALVLPIIILNSFISCQVWGREEIILETQFNLEDTRTESPWHVGRWLADWWVTWALGNGQVCGQKQYPLPKKSTQAAALHCYFANRSRNNFSPHLCFHGIVCSSHY